MIVRISGMGQFRLDDNAVKQLDALDTRLTDALNEQNEEEFRATLAETIQFVQESGTEVPDTEVVPSEVIVPPEDVTLAEARDFFTDEGLMAPLPA